VHQAYEIVEEEAMKADRAKAQARRAKDTMEGQMVKV
jgi:hypothetical protein